MASKESPPTTISGLQLTLHGNPCDYTALFQPRDCWRQSSITPLTTRSHPSTVLATSLGPFVAAVAPRAMQTLFSERNMDIHRPRSFDFCVAWRPVHAWRVGVEAQDVAPEFRTLRTA